jgi:hypothetical protein
MVNGGWSVITIIRPAENRKHELSLAKRGASRVGDERPTTIENWASKILYALINELCQARDELVFHDVPRRGKWGTLTAITFSTALGNAFARAIAKRYAKPGRGPIWSEARLIDGKPGPGQLFRHWECPVDNFADRAESRRFSLDTGMRRVSNGWS